MVLNISGTTEPSVAEFIDNPSHRQVASFLLGWVFVIGSRYAFLSPLVVSAVTWLRSRFISTGPTVEGKSLHAHRSQFSDEKWGCDAARDLPSQSSRSIQDCPALILALNVCVVSAALASFASYLSFPATGPACAFTVAWANMSTQLSRSVALSVLFKHLRSAGGNTIEIALCWTILVASLGLGLVNVVIDVGIMKTIETPEFSIVLCYQRQFLPTSISATSVYILLGVHVLYRLLALHRFSWTIQPLPQQVQVLRVASFLALEILTAVPSAIFVGVLADSATYCAGALLMLLAYNISYLTPARQLSTLCQRTHLKDQSASYQFPSVETNTRTPAQSFTVSLPDHPYCSRQPSPGKHMSRISNCSCSIEEGGARSYSVHSIGSEINAPKPPKNGPPAQMSFWQPSPMSSSTRRSSTGTTDSDQTRNSFQPNETTPLTAARRHLRVVSTLLEMDVGVDSRPVSLDAQSSKSVLYEPHVLRSDSPFANGVEDQSSRRPRSGITSHNTGALNAPSVTSYGSTLPRTPAILPSKPRRPLASMGAHVHQVSALAQRVGKLPAPLMVVPSEPLRGVVIYSEHPTSR